MNSTLKYARLGVIGMALAIAPAATAQGSMQSSDIVPGTGMTVAELRDLGYNQQQIAEIRNTDLNMSEQAGNMADRAGNEAQQAGNRAAGETRDTANDVQRAATDEGGSNWGWLGLFGLLGLLGLRGGKKHAAVHDDRDIRRVA
jgi:hypothetical protein